MPHATAKDGCRLYWEEAGAGVPVVAFHLRPSDQPWVGPVVVDDHPERHPGRPFPGHCPGVTELTDLVDLGVERLVPDLEPTIGEVLANVAKEEARHYTFYRTIFKEVLARDPNRGLASAAEIMPSIDMPGVNMPHFREMGDVIRRAGIYGPRDYLKIVEEQIRFWAIDKIVDGLDDLGKKAQEKIMQAGLPPLLAERLSVGR